MATDGGKTAKRNPALLSGEFGGALPQMVPGGSLDGEEESVSLPEISRSFDDLTPAAADLPDDDEAFEEESFWEEVSGTFDDEDDEDSRQTLDDDAPAAPDSAEFEAADTAELAPVETEKTPIEQTLPPHKPAAVPDVADEDEDEDEEEQPAAEPLEDTFDPLMESTPWVQPGRRWGVGLAIAAVALLAIGTGAWLIYLATQGPVTGDGASSIVDAAPPTQGLGAAVLPAMPATAEAAAEAAPVERAAAQPGEEEPVAEAAPVEESEPPDDGVVSAETMAERVDGSFQVESAVEEDPWSAPAEEPVGPAGVDLYHAPIEQVVVGDKVLVRTTTPGFENCQVHLYWHRPGEALQQYAMYRSGASHSLVLTVAPEMGPLFEYFLVATGCGAGVWPASGKTQAVAVR